MRRTARPCGVEQPRNLMFTPHAQDVPKFVDALMALVAAGDVAFQQNCRDVARADSLLGLRQRVQEKLRGLLCGRFVLLNV